MDLTPTQRKLIQAPLDAKFFLSGPAGSGKTTVGVERILHLLEQGIAGESILVLTPQRTLGAPYLETLRGPRAGPGGQATVMTVGGLAQRTMELFWPLVAEKAGFAHPYHSPVFLTLETAQYYMARLARPLLDQGYFESVTIDRNRLYSQVLDNLNKSAVVGFPHTEIGERLDAAWIGDPSQRRVYADAQECANLFRAYCLKHNLLDFSLQLDAFWNILWPDTTVRSYLQRTYRHLIYDNAEEDAPRAHDLIKEWSADFQSILMICDLGGGYRRFLGADPESGWALRQLCQEQVVMSESFVISSEVENIANSLAQAILPSSPTPLSLGSRPKKKKDKRPISDVLTFSDARFYPQMLDWVADEIHDLISEQKIPASEIVVLAPYLSDALRFSLTNRLEAHQVAWRSHRPSRSLRDEAATQGLLTLAALAHPDWDWHPSRYDLTRTFLLVLKDIDLVRAQLLAEIVYRVKQFDLSPFDQVKPEVQERITYTFGGRYAMLRDWLLAYRESEPQPLDHFLRRLFGEVLSQPGFGFHDNLDAARVAANLVESIQKFRWAMEPVTFDQSGRSDQLDYQAAGLEYVRLLNDGVIAAQYLQSWRDDVSQAVLLAPAYTFLMMNRPVEVQFWLDPGSSGWYERLFQPLTQPYVLSRHWPRTRQWSDADEVAAAQESLARLVTGLLRRCKRKLYLGLSELGESGFEQRGDLLKAFQRMLQEINE